MVVIGWVADAVGLAGGALMVFAYAYSNIARPVDFVLFNAANLVGAILLGASLTVHFNFPSLLLEIAWGGIALVGLCKAWLTRGRA